MLLAEALAERREILDRIAKVGDRWVRVATWDEDQVAPSQAEADVSVAGLTDDLDRLQVLNVTSIAPTTKPPSHGTVMRSRSWRRSHCAIGSTWSG